MKNNSQNNNYSFLFDFKEEQKFLNYKNLNHDSYKNSINENNFTKSGKNCKKNVNNKQNNLNHYIYFV